MKLQLVGILGVLAAATSGCASDLPSTITFEPSGALRALGVTTIQVVKSDTRLAIDGRDANGQLVANLELRTGTFVMQFDDRGLVDGRQLSVRVGKRTIEHESAGYAALNLPYPQQGDVGKFLLDPAVEAVLQDWGVGIDSSNVHVDVDELTLRPPHETQSLTCAYYNRSQTGETGCTASPFAGCAGTSARAWARANHETGEYRCCPSNYTANERTCSAANSWTSCGQAGPGNSVTGCAVCWSAADLGECEVSETDGHCTLTWCLEGQY